MSPRVEPGVLRAMTAHAREAHPMEAVGAVLGAGGVAVDYVRLENVSPTPASAFSVDPLDFVRIDGEARDRGLTLLGLFHSHPGGAAEPSDADRRGAWPGQCCWIGALRADGSIELGAFPLNGGSLAAGQADRQKRIV
ncbi:MAG: M67 family metallopeptidase [Planctomycetota bacterium]|nr:M67 family metallopeptidase [Planctomycetota bacterium]MDA1222890.1 M67 family metallopeptidase [Planctomycetota bacterium]